MRNEDIDEVLRRIADAVPGYHDPTSVGEVAEQTRDPFLVLCATLISLRNREEVTRVAQWRLFALARTPAAMAARSLAEITAALGPTMYAGRKAVTLRTIAEQLATKHGGVVPGTREGLLAFKGVGLKTANLVLGLAFGVPAICVDVHVHRIFNRLGYVRTRTPDETEAALRKKLPAQYWTPVNQWLVPFGRNQCTPSSPRCSSCPVEALCAKRGVTRAR